MESSEPRCSRGGEVGGKRGMNSNWAKFVLKRNDMFLLLLCLSRSEFHSYSNSAGRHHREHRVKLRKDGQHHRIDSEQKGHHGSLLRQPKCY